MEYVGKNNVELLEIMSRTLMITNRTYDSYVDWDNIVLNDEDSVILNAMNCLIKCDNFKERFKILLKTVPKTITMFPMLLAISKTEREKLLKNNKNKLTILKEYLEKYDYNSYNFSSQKAEDGLTDEDIEHYYNFFDKTGLKRLCTEYLQKSFYDYVIGILVGMDTNGRKNRSGTFFEKICELQIKPIAEKHDIKLYTQKKLWKLEDYNFPKELNKKNDFILTKEDKVLNIEVNFYNTQGSKPTETLDSYLKRKEDLAKHNIDFILITDGNAWEKKMADVLEKHFGKMKIMNYHMLKDGYLDELLTATFD